MNSNREKVSYCIGLETGRNLKNQFKDLDIELLENGLRDAMGDKPPALPKEEIGSILKSLQEKLELQQKEYVSKLSEENRQEGLEFLEQNKQNPGVITMPSGLQYRILSAGAPEGKKPTMLDAVSCHYRGSTIDGKVFDSSYERGQPQSFPMNRVIPGWSEALKMMRVGDKWEIFVPSYLAYGENGYGPYIQPNMTLVFQMELVAIQ